MTPLLSAILGVNIQKNKTNADGVVELLAQSGSFLLYLEEYKNEIGDGGSDPSTQACLSGARYWAQHRVYESHIFSLLFFLTVHSLVRKASKCHQLPHISRSRCWSMDRDPWCCLHRWLDCPTSDRLHLGRIRLRSMRASYFTRCTNLVCLKE